jgi:hypothetical protein
VIDPEPRTDLTETASALTIRSDDRLLEDCAVSGHAKPRKAVSNFPGSVQSGGLFAFGLIIPNSTICDAASFSVSRDAAAADRNAWFEL